MSASKKSKRRRKQPSIQQAAREKDAFNLQRLLAVAATVVAIGIYLVGTRESEPGMVLVLVSLAGLMACIHRYGRLGEDGVAPAKRRRRKAKA
jgi:hypothetical protein